METEVLGNIPRLYTALADWLACLLYLFFLPKRKAGWRRYTIHAVFLLLLGVFMQATGQVPQFWFLPCIAVSILIMYLYIRMQADVPARSAGYYCVRAFILGELAASLEWQTLLLYGRARVEKPPSAREVPRRGGGREPCHSPKYFGQPYSSLPHRLRAEPPRRGGQGVSWGGRGGGGPGEGARRPGGTGGGRGGLEFEGVYHNAEVWLNGQKAAFRPYGYTNFYVDCAPYLHAGENELRVIACNADQPNSRWYSGAGIYRPVQLWTARGAHIALNGVKIRTLSLDPAVVEVRVKTTAPGTVRLTVDDLPAVQQESDGEAVFALTLDNARLWTPETPNLYTCRVSFADDVVTETFGVRKVEWGTDGFLLNGKRYIIQGACIHHDNGLLGAVCDPDAVARKVRLLKANGYNAIRSAHNPCSKALLAECDRRACLSWTSTSTIGTSTKPSMTTWIISTTGGIRI